MTSSSPRIPSAELAELIDDFAAEADRRTYPLSDRRAWPAVRREELSDDDVSALRFVTFIEDHTPGYFAEYLRLFPLEPELPEDEFLFNREMHRFSTRWAVDEERHASLLFKYQVHAGIARADELRRELAREGRKPFALDHRAHIAGVVAYTVIQEKATQLFYRLFEKRLREPLLASLMGVLARDESRHFAFYARVLEAFVRHASASSLDAVKEVLFTFKMPLATTLKGYWRWSIRLAEAMGYDHTEAYEPLVRLVQRTADASTRSRVADLAAFVQGLR